jgi:hypothetical protein
MSNSRWRDALIAVVVFGGTLLWMADATGPGGYTGTVDYSTIIRGDRVAAFDANHRRVSFSQLAGFEYFESRRLAGVPTSAPRETIPEQIRALDGTRVSIDGFMMPLDYDGGVRTFVLNASYDMCQFGAPSIVNQRIDVSMVEGKRTVFVHTPIRVYGVMEVGEEYDRGHLVSIYRLKADGVFIGG